MFRTLRTTTLRFAAIDQNFDYYTLVIAVNDGFTQKNQTLLRLAALRGYRFCVSNPDEAAEIL